MEGGVCGGEGVFGVAAVWGEHYVECGDAVSGFEFGDVGADFMDVAGDVVAAVHGFGGVDWVLGFVRRFGEGGGW